jgi:amidase
VSAADLVSLTACQAARRISEGTLTSEALVRTCLERIDARDMSVAAFACVDPEYAIRQAKERDRSRGNGPLHGIPVAFKDIIDTAGLPTSYGSKAYLGHQPKADAACVSAALEAGAVVLGKAATTEFAGRHPAPTSHPRNRLHSPGGSSSGSAAAVADGMVPLAIGSQTAGSTIRPASYCGVHGYKPTFGLLSLAGVHPLAASFDTLGLFARSVEDLMLFLDALLGLPARALEEPPAPRIALCRTPYWDKAQPAMQQAVLDAADLLKKGGATVAELELPRGFEDLEQTTWSIVHFEAARTLMPEWRRSPDSLGGATRRMIREGLAVPYERYLADMRSIERQRPVIHEALEGFDVVLTPSAVGEAPLGLEDTGPVTFNFLWHVMNMPAITLPAFNGPQGLPLGVQLVARRYEDDRLLAFARWSAKKLGLPG